MKKLVSIIFTIVIIGTFLACKTPPTEDMNKAIDAVTRAENDADAVTYAGNTLVRARDALTQMQAEADSKRYDSAKNYAAEAIAAAEKALTDGKTGAARAREEAANLLNSIKPEIVQTEGELAAAKQVQGIQLDFNALDRDMASAKTAAAAAQSSFDASNYRDAVTKAQPIRPILSGIRTRISDAAIATSRKK
ncbi:MAG: DUF4398 domain-containing protein [Treponema sp.]|jgi:hypothetical protein|nr:DUF4398 domain-containing protein [Treponema sp.]